MKFRYTISLPIAVYIGLSIGGFIKHSRNYSESINASQNPNNPVELREACREYAQNELELLEFPNILNPFSGGESKPYEPVFRLKEQPREGTQSDGL